MTLNKLLELLNGIKANRKVRKIEKKARVKR